MQDAQQDQQQLPEGDKHVERPDQRGVEQPLPGGIPAHQHSQTTSPQSKPVN